MLSNTCPEMIPSGILLLDKPKDFSSHDVVAIARRALHVKKIGHSGTLDPMATGLLILLVGREATKQQDGFLKLAKTYTAVLSLGQQTDSWDAYGKVTATKPVPPLTQEQVLLATHQLTGTIEQPIPFFSAKKINGEKMYSLARQGAELERRYNTVSVQWKNVCLTDEKTIHFTVHCSCGTYVRALGYLLAKELGTVGHLTQLRRTQIGSYCVTEALDATQLKTTPADELYKRIIPL